MKKIFLLSLFLFFLFILLWSPWLIIHGDKGLIKKIENSEDYNKKMQGVAQSIYCDNLSSIWIPFGRKINYCGGRIEWKVNFLGSIKQTEMVNYIPDEEMLEQVKKFDFYIDGGEKDFCKNWNINIPIITQAELVKITPLVDHGISPEDDITILRFKKDNREQNFSFPTSIVNTEDYELGKIYEIDMNNICVYYLMYMKMGNREKYREKFIQPKFLE